MTLALWDQIITFHDEFEVIWFRSFDLAKLVYLLNRWGVGAGLIYAAYGIVVCRSPQSASMAADYV